jgi:hypothetical protein
MGYDAKTERLIALKKLAGKAQTSNDKGLSNEALPSGITSTSETIFGEAISTSPSSTALYTVTGKVEYVRFPTSFIAGSDTSAGRHGFELKLPSDYESNSSNSKAGTYPFQNNQTINITSGSLQLVPTSFATSYEAKPYYGGTSAKDSGTQIPLLDARDWYLDYFNGVFFQQDPTGTGDQADNPDYVEAYLYIGDMLNTIVTAAGGTGGTGDPNAQYLVLAATGSLTAERVLTAGTGISTTDAGAGGAYTVAVNNSVVATLTGSQFSGTVGVTGSIGSTSKITSPAFSGSLTHLQDGTSYLKAGANVTVTSASNGSITIASTNTTYTAGDGLDLSGTEFSVDLKSSGGLEIDSTELAIDDSIVATISGSTFTGAVKFNSGLSGSLTHLANGTSYLREGSNVGISTGSDGSITISSSPGGTGDSSAQYLVLAATGSLSAERVFTAGTGISTTDAGAGAAYTIAVDNSIVATISGSTFTGAVKFNSGLSGSLTHLADGTSYLREGSNISITSGSNGSVTIAATGGASGAPSDAQYLTLATDNDLTDERVFTAGTGIATTDAGAGSTFTVGIDNSVVATLTGSVFSGNVVAQAGLSGSIQLLSDGATRYIVGNGSINVSTGSSGQLVISSSAGSRKKDVYFIGSDISAGGAVGVTNSDFSMVAYKPSLIDVLLNGQMLHSGSSVQVGSSERDYYVDTSTSLKFAFDVKIDDVLDIIVYNIQE